MEEKELQIDDELIFELLKRYEFIFALDYLFTRTERNFNKIIKEQLYLPFHWKDDIAFMENLVSKHNISNQQTKLEITALIKGIICEVHYFYVDDPVNEIIEHKTFVEDLKQAQKLIMEISKPRNERKDVLKFSLESISFTFKSRKIINLFVSELKNLMGDKINEEILRLQNTEKESDIDHFRISKRTANLDQNVNTELRRKVANILYDYSNQKRIFKTKNSGFLFISDILVYLNFLQSEEDRRRHADGEYDDGKLYFNYDEYCIQNVKRILKYNRPQIDGDTGQ